MIIFCNNAFAGKYDLMFGMYSYSAKVSNKTTAVSGLGTYEGSYLMPLKDHFEISLGYSFTMTGIIGGDYSYGPKLGVNYYPVNFASNEKIELPNKTIEIHDFYKPYIGVAFNQRQFQSAKTSYAGFGFSLGCEKYINSNYTIKSEVKMNSYTGASEAQATETNILIGLVLGF
jgi:hypothetical protein